MFIKPGKFWIMLLLFVSLSVHAKNQALLITISAYPSPWMLPGVTQDIRNGTDIAIKMGISPQNITVMKDADASRQNIRNKLTEIAEQATAKDHIFIYFSGHGTQRMDQASQKSDKCSEGIVTREACCGVV
jgi:hypothetical protein